MPDPDLVFSFEKKDGSGSGICFEENAESVGTYLDKTNTDP